MSIGKGCWSFKGIEMASNSWLKLYIEILDDPKMARMSDHLWRRTIEMLLLAGRNGQAGGLPPVEDMAWTLRTSEAELAVELAEIAKRGIVTELETGGWVVTKFSERQGPSPVKQRVEEYRKRKREAQQPAPLPPMPPDDFQPGNANVTKRYTECNDDKSPDTDTDTDTDTEVVDDDSDGFTTGVLAPFEEVYIRETQMPIMFPNPQAYIEGLQKIQQTGATPEDLEKGIRALKRNKKYRISGPSSCINAAVIAMGERKATNEANPSETWQQIKELYPTFRAEVQ